MLLTELDDWVNSTHGQLKAELPKFTSVSAVVKELSVSKVSPITILIALQESKPNSIVNAVYGCTATGRGHENAPSPTSRSDQTMRRIAELAGRNGAAGQSAVRAPVRPAGEFRRGGRPVALAIASSPGMTGRLQVRTSTTTHWRLFGVGGGGHPIVYFHSSF